MSETPPANSVSSTAGSAGPARQPNRGPHDAAPGDGARARRPANGAAPGLEDVNFLTVAEVAGIMRVSKMTVYRMVHSGELSAVRVGRSFRVPERAVRDYLSAAFVERD